MKKQLFEESGSEAEELTMNEEYAKKFEKKKKMEELAMLEAKYQPKKKSKKGEEDVSENEEEYPSEEEDDEGKYEPEEWKDDFLSVLPLLLSKSKALYDKNNTFFDSEAQTAHLREQLKLKQEFLKAAGQSVDEESEEEEDMGGLITLKKKTPEEIAEEEEHYKVWKKEHDERLQKIAAELAASGAFEKGQTEKGDKKGKKAKKGAPAASTPGDEVLLRFWKQDANLSEDEKFLRKYIWDQLWIENENNKEEYYKEEMEEDMSSSEEELDREDEFENAYNFRFENPEGAKIIQYPRKVEDSVRVTKKTKTRAEKRRERKERKELEIMQKREEIERMKALQKEKIVEQLRQIQEATGESDMKITEEDLDEDFDPDKWDKKMSEMFGDDFYAKEEDEKPVFEEDDYLDSVEPLGKKELEEAEAAAEAEIAAKESEAVKEALESGSALMGKRLKKKAKKAMAAGAAPEDTEMSEMTPQDIQAMIDKYYALDFEDIVGGVRCRFKYTQVEPDRSGITVEDILNADDEEMKRVVPIRDIAPYIPAEEQVTNKKIDWKSELGNARKAIEKEKAQKKAARKAQKERSKKFKAAKRAAAENAAAKEAPAAPPAKKAKKASPKTAPKSKK